MTSAYSTMNLRLPVPLKNELRKAARVSKRSITKEIEVAIEAYLRKQPKKEAVSA